MKDIAIVLLSVALGALGQIAFKYGALQIPATGTLLDKITWPIVLGLGLYGISTILWIQALRSVELSFAYPLISLGYVFVFLASYFLFHEAIGLSRVAGLALILGGIFLVARS